MPAMADLTHPRELGATNVGGLRQVSYTGALLDPNVGTWGGK